MTMTIRVRSFVWLATGVVLSLLAMLIVTQAWRADAAPGDEDATYVPITNCRLFDTRPGADNVGQKNTPIGPGNANVMTQQVTGSNGNCVGIPADAIAVAMNVTIVSPTAQSNLRLFPANVLPPLSSNLNWVAGQSPTPNKVDVKLSPSGQIKLLNHAGTVHAIGDVVGYYTNASLQELAADIAELRTAQPFAVMATAGVVALQAPTISVNSVTVAAPVDGHVTVSSSATVLVGAQVGSDIACGIEADSSRTLWGLGSTHGQWFERSAANVGTISGSRVFPVVGNNTTTYHLTCREFVDPGEVRNSTLTAIFTPAP